MQMKPELKNILERTSVSWAETGDVYFPYVTKIAGEEIKLRIGDFPDEPLYTVINGIGEEIMKINGFPDNWSR